MAQLLYQNNHKSNMDGKLLQAYKIICNTPDLKKLIKNYGIKEVIKWAKRDIEESIKTVYAYKPTTTKK